MATVVQLICSAAYPPIPEGKCSDGVRLVPDGVEWDWMGRFEWDCVGLCGMGWDLVGLGGMGNERKYAGGV